MTIIIFILIFLSFLCYIADISEGAEVSVMTFIIIIDIGIGAAIVVILTRTRRLFLQKHYILAWISHYSHHNMCDEIIYPFPNFNGWTVYIWQRISDFALHFTVHVITYSCWD